MMTDLYKNQGTYINQEDWRKPFVEYMRNPVAFDKNFKRLVMKYLLLDDELYKRTVNVI